MLKLGKYNLKISVIDCNLVNKFKNDYYIQREILYIHIFKKILLIISLALY